MTSYILFFYKKNPQRRENALLATFNYRSLGYQINRRQNSTEITNNETIDDNDIFKQQL